MSAVLTEVKKERASLSQTRKSLREHANADHVVTVEAGTTLEELHKPSFWAHNAKDFRPYDKVYVCIDDDSYYAEFLVLRCDRNSALVKALCVYQLNAEDVIPAALPQGYRVEHAGRFHKWRVVREADSAAIKTGCETKREAEDWLASHLKAA